MSQPTASDIDRATITTWPATVTEERNGWFYLAAGGVTGRVNAVWPLDWRGDDIEMAINSAEAWYAARGLPPRFKLTDRAFAPGDLPDRLARRGYECVMPTLIMTRNLALRPPVFDNVAISPQLPALFDQALRDSSINTDDLEERRSIARRLPTPAAFAVRAPAGQAAAVGASAVAGKLAVDSDKVVQRFRLSA